MLESEKDILVMSKEDAISFSATTEINSAIISISNVSDDYPMFLINNDIRYILYLKFDDEEDGQNAMTKEDAAKVFEFVEKVKSKIDLLVVHCQAGISRSAGVAAGIMKALFNNDFPIFNNKKYYPNRNCYRKTLEEFYEHIENGV